MDWIIPLKGPSRSLQRVLLPQWRFTAVAKIHSVLHVVGNVLQVLWLNICENVLDDNILFVVRGTLTAPVCVEHSTSFKLCSCVSSAGLLRIYNHKSANGVTGYMKQAVILKVLSWVSRIGPPYGYSKSGCIDTLSWLSCL